MKNKHNDTIKNKETFELWRCETCGFICSAEPEGSIGTIHAHAEKHIPFFEPLAQIDKLNSYIEKLKVVNYKVLDTEE